MDIIQDFFFILDAKLFQEPRKGENKDSER